MNANHFDAFFRSLASASAPSRSRRGVLADLTSALLAVLPLGLGGEETAAKKKKKKGKKSKKNKPSPSQAQPALNAYGCLDVGQPCQGDGALCCSGICDAGTSTCAAHNAGICFADSDSCSVGANVSCNPSNRNCLCLKTTGNAGFCGELGGSANGPADFCRFCSADTDCQAEFGAGAACVVLAGACTAFCAATGRTACVPACG